MPENVQGPNVSASRPGHLKSWNYLPTGQEVSNSSWLVCKVKDERDLGVTVSDTLPFSKFIASAAAKANRMLGMIKHSFSYIDKESLLVLYKTYVCPHLEYCAQACSPYLEKDQRRATKLVPKLSYEERLRELGLTTLEERRKRDDLIEMFKILRGVDFQMEFEIF